MSEIFLNANMIANLNELKSIPLPILKYICDKLIDQYFDRSKGLNEQLLEDVLKDEKVEAANWKKGFNSLRFALKECIRQQITVKAIANFIVEGTMLPKQFAQYFGQKYQELAQHKLESPKFGTVSDTNWGLFNLKQSVEGSSVNKIYLKTQVKTFQDGKQESISFTTSLPQLKLLVSEVEELYSKVQ